MAMYQVGISRADDSSVATLDEAVAAYVVLFGDIPAVGIEPVDAELGVYIVDLPSEYGSELEELGHLFINRGGFSLSAEMP